MRQSGSRVCDAEVSNYDKGKYSVTICVQEECLGKAHFTADGEHIDGIPFELIGCDYAQIQEPVLSFETPCKPTHFYVNHRNDDIFVMLKDVEVSIHSCHAWCSKIYHCMHIVALVS